MPDLSKVRPINEELVSTLATKYGSEVSDKYKQLFLDPNNTGKSDVFLLDRALYLVHKKEIDSAAPDPSLPFMAVDKFAKI